MNIEKYIIKHLNDNLTGGVKAYAEIPSSGAEYVTVNLYNGACVNYIFSATVEIKSTSTTKLKAQALNEKVQGIMETFADLPQVLTCKIGGFSNDTDTANKRYRYETIYNISY